MPSETPQDTRTVLIADDSAMSRRLLEAVLKKWGYGVIAVASGLEAWEILQRDDAPQMAILDWMMPGYSGPEVCSMVRNLNRVRYTYLILLTSKHEKSDLIIGMESGADDYLVKPFDSNELKVRLGPGRRIIELQDELLRTQEALRDQAMRDALTSLWNRRAIFELLGRELNRSYREKVPMGLVLGDIDRFKLVNDTYGHVAGDAVLREVAQRIIASIRPYDAAGRYGGEEFLVILPGCSNEEARSTAERLREQIQAGPFQLPEGDLRVTVSFGVVAISGGRECTPEVLIKAADEALYRAKALGRNRSESVAFA